MNTKDPKDPKDPKKLENVKSETKRKTITLKKGINWNIAEPKKKVDTKPRRKKTNINQGHIYNISDEFDINNDRTNEPKKTRKTAKTKKKYKLISNSETKYLEKYINEIGNQSILSSEEEVELAKKIKLGDKDALNTLVKANLRFVVTVCKQYPNKGLSLGDLINEGNIGLIKAAKRFDPKKGFKFISYAVWWCRQAIMQAIAEYSRMVRLPMNKFSLLYKENQHLYLPINKLELLSKKDYDKKRAIDNTVKYVSLDAPIGDDSNLYDVMRSDEYHGPDKVLIHQSLKIDILKILNTLTDREKYIIVKSFGLDGNPSKTLEEIGKTQNLTRERVRQIKEEVCKKLRSIAHGLKDYLSFLDSLDN